MQWPQPLSPPAATPGPPMPVATPQHHSWMSNRGHGPCSAVTGTWVSGLLLLWDGCASLCGYSPGWVFPDKGWVEISLKICPLVLVSAAQWSCVFMKAHYVVANALCVQQSLRSCLLFQAARCVCYQSVGIWGLPWMNKHQSSSTQRHLVCGVQQ